MFTVKEISEYMKRLSVAARQSTINQKKWQFVLIGKLLYRQMVVDLECSLYLLLKISPSTYYELTT